jgi:hypothetical protein
MGEGLAWAVAELSDSAIAAFAFTGQGHTSQRMSAGMHHKARVIPLWLICEDLT